MNNLSGFELRGASDYKLLNRGAIYAISRWMTTKRILSRDYGGIGFTLALSHLMRRVPEELKLVFFRRGGRYKRITISRRFPGDVTLPYIFLFFALFRFNTFGICGHRTVLDVISAAVVGSFLMISLASPLICCQDI